MERLTTDQMLLKAATVAARLHKTQKRKDDTPYIAHIMRVTIRCETKIQKVVALLHDAKEDQGLTLEEMRELGFTEEVIAAVDAISKRAYESYPEFILRVKQNPLATAVKLADIEDNLEDQSALDPDEASFLKKRYAKAQAVLLDS